MVIFLITQIHFIGFELIFELNVSVGRLLFRSLNLSLKTRIFLVFNGSCQHFS